MTLLQPVTIASHNRATSQTRYGRNSHPKLTAVGGSVDHAAHLTSMARDRLGQQWQECGCYKVYGGSVDEEGFDKMVSIT